MNQSPEQIAEQRKEFESWFISESTSLSVDRNLQKAHSWNGYLRRCTEQAAEIAALKAQIAELMPLAKFGAEVLKGFGSMSVTKNFFACAKHKVIADNCQELKPNIKATITKILKD